MPSVNSKQLTPKQAQERLETMCMRAEHCTGEMREKMRQWAISPTDAEGIIERLVQLKFVDDERFASAFVRDKIRLSHWGRQKVRNALYLKKVDRDTINTALEQVTDEECYEILHALLKSKVKFRPELLDDIQGRTKLYRFAVARGFESPLITRAVKALMSARAATDTDSV